MFTYLNTNSLQTQTISKAVSLHRSFFVFSLVYQVFDSVGYITQFLTQY